jgi:hypothetical protein
MKTSLLGNGMHFNSFINGQAVIPSLLLFTDFIDQVDSLLSVAGLECFQKASTPLGLHFYILSLTFRTMFRRFRHLPLLKSNPVAALLYSIQILLVTSPNIHVLSPPSPGNQ